MVSLRLLPNWKINDMFELQASWVIYQGCDESSCHQLSCLVITTPVLSCHERLSVATTSCQCLMSLMIAVQRAKLNLTARDVASLMLDTGREMGLVLTNMYGRACYIVRWKMSWATQLSLLASDHQPLSAAGPRLCFAGRQSWRKTRHFF